jgi:hypothetical protein
VAWVFRAHILIPHPEHDPSSLAKAHSWPTPFSRVWSQLDIEGRAYLRLAEGFSLSAEE